MDNSELKEDETDISIGELEGMTDAIHNRLQFVESKIRELKSG